MQRRTDDRAQEGMYNTEHWLAWAVALAAIVLGVIGVLRGFGLLGGGVDVAGVSTGSPGTRAGGFGAIWDAAVWQLAAISAGLLAMALHRNEHHRARSPELANDTTEGLWKTEHGLAWLMALITIVTAVLGILVGFDVFGRGNDQPDALPWLLAGVLSGTLTVTLHAVRHHQMVSDEDYITRVVEQRVSRGAPAPTTVHESGTEHRP